MTEDGSVQNFEIEEPITPQVVIKGSMENRRIRREREKLLKQKKKKKKLALSK